MPPLDNNKSSAFKSYHTHGGADLVNDGGFDDASQWDDSDANWVIAGSKATHTPGATGDIKQDGILPVDDDYAITMTISGRTAGSLTPKAGTAVGTARSADGIHSETIIGAGNTNLVFTPTTDFDGSIELAKAYKVHEAGAIISTKAINLYQITGRNDNGSIRYIMLFNRIDAAAQGDVPLLEREVAAGSDFNRLFGDNGIHFDTGLYWAVSTTPHYLTPGESSCEIDVMYA